MRKSFTVAAFLVLTVPAFAGSDLLGAAVVNSYVKPKGAFLNIVTPGGSAANAGLLSGDIVTGIDGKPVTDANGLEQALARHHGGDKVRLDVVHLGKPEHITMSLIGTGARPAVRTAARANAAPPARPAAPIARAQPSHVLPAVHWTRYRDPSEGAFTIEVPAGWRVRGGARRISAPEIRYGVEATSPDGQITLFYGDVNVPVFSVPNQMFAMAGLRPGMTYNMGMGVQTIIEPYMSGQAFAANWGVRRIARDCAGATLVGHRGRPDSSKAISRVYAGAGLMHSMLAGEASFRCRLNGGEAGGYVFASTELLQMQASAMWDVNALMGCIAASGRAGEASLLLAHMAQSFSIDRGWLARQQMLNQKFNQIVEQTNQAVAARIAANGRAQQEISDMIVKGGAERSRATSNAIEKYDEFAVRGTSDYTDGNGRLYTNVDNEHAHVFVNNATGRVMPTDSENSPGAGWTELQRVPPGQ